MATKTHSPGIGKESWKSSSDQSDEHFLLFVYYIRAGQIMGAHDSSGRLDFEWNGITEL